MEYWIFIWELPWPLWLYNVFCCCVKLLQSCLTLWDLMDCSTRGFSVHGILQARILEWVAMPSSRGSSWPRNWTHISRLWQAGSLPLAQPGKHNAFVVKTVVMTMKTQLMGPLSKAASYMSCPSWVHGTVTMTVVSEIWWVTLTHADRCASAHLCVNKVLS